MGFTAKGTAIVTDGPPEETLESHLRAFVLGARRRHSACGGSPIRPSAALAFIYADGGDAVDGGGCALDLSGLIVAIDDGWRRFAERHDADPLSDHGLGRNYVDACSVAARQGDRSAHAVLFRLHDLLGAAATAFTYKYHCDTPSGRRWFIIDAERTAIGAESFILVAHTDVTDLADGRADAGQDRAESGDPAPVEEIAEREIFTRVADVASDLIWHWNPATDKLFLSSRFRGLLAGPLPTSGRDLLGLIHPDDRDRFVQIGLARSTHGGVASVDVRVLCQGHFYHRLRFSLNAEKLSANAGRQPVRHVIGVVTPVTETDVLLQGVQRPTNDPVTGLVRALAFFEKLGRLTRGAGDRHVVLAVELLHYREMILADGVDVCREALSIVGERLQALPFDDLVCSRIANGIFGLVCRVEGAVACHDMADALLAVLSGPIVAGGVAVQPQIRIGMAEIEAGDRRGGEALFGDAEMALRVAKRSSGRQWQVFTPCMRIDAIASYGIISRLRALVQRPTLALPSQFSIHYQPVVRLNDRRQVGFEALARYHDDVLGPVSPSTFIPLLEAAGLMPTLGRMLFRAAAMQLGARRPGAGEPDIDFVAVNVSQAQLDQADFVRYLVADTEQSGADPGRIKLEITETTLVNDLEKASRIVEEIKDNGFKVAIDDFGTGFSSLSHISEFRFDDLKIDARLTSKLPFNVRKQRIIRSVIRMAEDIGAVVTAEGIETEAQDRVLCDMNCAFGQGYLYGRPQLPQALNWAC